MRRTTSLIAAIILAACSREASSAAPRGAVQSGEPGHHEIRIDRLPPPGATPSSANSARISRRPANANLQLPPGFHVALYASKLDNPRNMIQAPNGDVIVAETGANRISILRDANGDGVPEQRFTYSTAAKEPFGLALHGQWLYVGATNALLRFPYRPGDTAAGPPERLAALPTGGHSTRNITFSPDGNTLYVAIGSESNVSAEGPPRAAIMAFTADGKQPRTFASGLRNPVGLAWNPANRSLWTAVNERDGLGDDLVPDYITDVRPNTFYGWPYSYLGQHVDPRRKGEHPELVARAVVPSVLLQAHSAPLGLVFYDGTMFPPEFRGNAFVALHGSWNRSLLTGYKVVRVAFRDGKPLPGYDDFVTGWLADASNGVVWGRPVGLLVLRDGSLLIADDGGDVIWRVTYAH